MWLVVWGAHPSPNDANVPHRTQLAVPGAAPSWLRAWTLLSKPRLPGNPGLCPVVCGLHVASGPHGPTLVRAIPTGAAQSVNQGTAPTRLVHDSLTEALQISIHSIAIVVIAIAEMRIRLAGLTGA